MGHGRDCDDRPARVRAAACMVVGELFDTADADRLLGVEPQSDFEFADHLIDRELGLIAIGEDPLRIALRLAVLSIARDSLRTYAEIHALPESGPTGIKPPIPDPRAPNPAARRG